jgi:hypothetical protein
MRKLSVCAAAVLCLLVFTPSLWATLCHNCVNTGTWTDLYDPADIFLDRCGAVRSVNIPLDITRDGFEPGVDKAIRYQIDVRLYDDKDAGGEVAWFIIPKSTGFEFFSFDSDRATIRSDLLRLMALNDDGALSLTLKVLCGDFYFDWAKITAFGCDNGTAPVPEPATVLLLGSGAAGLLGYGRRKFKKS